MSENNLEEKINDDSGVDENEYETINIYNSELLNDPNWIGIAQATKFTGVGDRQTRNLAKQYKWKKVHVKKDGKPFALLAKADVLDYAIKHKNYNIAEGEIVSSSFTENTLENIHEKGGNTPEIPHGKAILPGNLNSDDLRNILLGIQKEVVGSMNNHATIQKEMVEKIETLEKAHSKSEKSVMFWRTSVFWIGVMIIAAGALTFKVIQDAERQTSVLSKDNKALNEKLSSMQKDYYETKLKVAEKENEVLTLKNTVSQIKTAQQAEGKPIVIDTPEKFIAPEINPQPAQTEAQ